MTVSSDTEPHSTNMMGSILCLEALRVPVQQSMQAQTATYWAGSRGTGATSGPQLG